MPDKGHPSRPWREIAKEVSKEQNSKRFWELTIELDKALEAEENKEKSTPLQANETLKVWFKAGLR